MSRQDRLNRLELTELNTDDSKEKSVSVWEKVQLGDIVQFCCEYIGIVSAIYPQCAFPNSFIVKFDYKHLSAGNRFLAFDKKAKIDIKVNHNDLAVVIEDAKCYETEAEIIFRVL